MAADKFGGWKEEEEEEEEEEEKEKMSICWPTLLSEGAWVKSVKNVLQKMYKNLCRKLNTVLGAWRAAPPSSLYTLSRQSHLCDISTKDRAKMVGLDDPWIVWVN